MTTAIQPSPERIDNPYLRIVEPFSEVQWTGVKSVHTRFFLDEAGRFEWEPPKEETLALLESVAPDLAQQAREQIEAPHASGLFDFRTPLTRKYSWTIPDKTIIYTFAATSPILSVGAGTAYIEHLLVQAGADVVATDAHVWPNTTYNHTEPWMPIEELDAVAAVQKYPERTLMLSWPPHSKPMAYDALRATKADTVLYIGEHQGGCTGSEEFFELLADEFELLSELRPLQWDGMHDWAFVYRRKV